MKSKVNAEFLSLDLLLIFHSRRALVIDLFSLYVLFSHFRPRDALMGICLLSFISYAHICTCIRRHLKETIPSSSITWSEMGKQNIQAKEVYSQGLMRFSNNSASWSMYKERKRIMSTSLDSISIFQGKFFGLDKSKYFIM